MKFLSPEDRITCSSCVNGMDLSEEKMFSTSSGGEYTHTLSNTWSSVGKMALQEFTFKVLLVKFKSKQRPTYKSWHFESK